MQQQQLKLAKSRKELLQQAADLRSPKKVTDAIHAGAVSSTACPKEYELAALMTRDEQEFWHAFLANADVFASIRENAGRETPFGWGDICFATADAIYDLLVDRAQGNDRGKRIVLFDKGRGLKDAWMILANRLLDRDAVMLFDLDGDAESHKFIVYPVSNGRVLLAQSVGGIMRATLRIFTVQEFSQLLFDAVRGSGAAAKDLFGYAIDENPIVRLAFYVGARRSDVGAHVLLNEMRQLSGADRERLRAIFAEHYDWDDFDIDQEVDDYFNMDTRVSRWPFYFVHPLTFEWQCASRAKDVPQSEVAIALQSGAVCPIKRNVN